MAAIALSVLFQTGAVVFGKAAAVSLGQFHPLDIAANGAYLMSLACLGLQAITWQLALARFPLSYAYSAMSIVYVNALILSHVLFREQVTTANVVGAVMIIAGVTLVTRFREAA